MSDKKEQIRALKEQLATQAAEHKAEQEKTAEAEELQRLEQQLQDNAAIMKAERELGKQGERFGCITAPDGRVIIYKAADYAKYREFQEAEDTKTVDAESLCEACRYYPDFEIYDKLHERFPGLLTPSMRLLAKLAGSSQAENAKK